MADGIPWSNRGDVRHNVPLDTLAADPDARFRPRHQLAQAVGEGGVLDRYCVPVLNALIDHGAETMSSCIGVHSMLGSDIGHINIRGIGARELAMLDAVKRPGMQMNLFVSGRQGRDKDEMASLTWGADLSDWAASEASWLDAADRVARLTLGRVRRSAEGTYLQRILEELDKAAQNGRGPGLVTTSGPGPWQYRVVSLLSHVDRWELAIKSMSGSAPDLMFVTAPTFATLRRTVALPLANLLAQPTGNLLDAEDRTEAVKVAGRIHDVLKSIFPKAALNQTFRMEGNTFTLRRIRYDVSSTEGPRTVVPRDASCVLKNGALAYDPRQAYVDDSGASFRPVGLSVRVLDPHKGWTTFRAPELPPYQQHHATYLQFERLMASLYEGPRKHL